MRSSIEERTNVGIFLHLFKTFLSPFDRSPGYGNFRLKLRGDDPDLLPPSGCVMSSATAQRSGGCICSFGGLITFLSCPRAIVGSARTGPFGRCSTVSSIILRRSS